ncbi:MAG: TrkA family potassium uptake protein [Chloroflexota bacterium]
MKVIVMGCGRVGEQLSWLLVSQGHQVTIVDQEADALARLGPKFPGHKVRGIGFDRNVLLQAGIEQADGFAATSSSDNANIIGARIARVIFGVPKVVARLYDPRRAEIYGRLGLITISSTTWGAERITELLTHSEMDAAYSFGSGEVSLLRIDLPVHLTGLQVKHLSIPGEIRVAAITRRGQAFIPLTGTEFQSGDVLHLIILASSMERLQELLGLQGGV